jgi:hypothetical protein
VTVKPDITLAELRDLLKRRGISAGIASLWRFFQSSTQSQVPGGFAK